MRAMEGTRREVDDAGWRGVVRGPELGSDSRACSESVGVVDEAACLPLGVVRPVRNRGTW